jgi:DNA-binding CsgD family transcriptional regulator
LLCIEPNRSPSAKLSKSWNFAWNLSMKWNGDAESKIIEAIYRGACDEGELTRALELIAAAFESPAIALGELDRSRPECQLTLGVGFMEGDELARYAEFAHLDPMPTAFAALPAGTVATSQGLIPNGARRSAFVSDYLIPLGAQETLGCPLFSSNGRFALISILQGVNQKDYDAHDVTRLERIVPHLTRTLQIRRLFLRSEARLKTLETIIDRNATGMIALSSEGPALFVNTAARSVAAARDGLSLNLHGAPVAADRAAATQLTGLVADVARGGSGGIVRVPRLSGRSPYVILVSRLPNVTGGILIAIHDAALHQPPLASRIAQMLDLPLGAAKVVQALLSGLSMSEYAKRAGISANTVRFHLKNAFSATGAHSQAELVRITLAAMRALHQHLPGDAAKD